MLLSQSLFRSLSGLCLRALHRGSRRRSGGRLRSRRAAISAATAPVEICETRTLLAAAVITESGGSTDVVEGGSNDTYTIVLDTAPTKNVPITITPDAQTNLGAGAGVAITLTFTDKNWSTPQTVTVTAVDDAVIEGKHTSTLVHDYGGSDSAYKSLANFNLVANVTDNDVAGVTITESGGSTDVTEGGATDTYTVVLNAQPTADVTVSVTPDGQLDVGGGSATPVNLTFTNANWNTPQTVTVSAFDDGTAEGPHTGKITHSTSSTDSNFNGLTVVDVTADITDDDVSSMTIVQSGGSTGVTEGGATDTYTVVLDSQPTSDVTVTVTPDAQTDLGGGAGVAVNLIFTNANWDTAQTVTVTAVDDDIDEGAHTSTITHAAASADLAFAGITGSNVVANITDNDFAGVTVVESGGSTDVTEGGATDSYTVVLDSQPTADVTITVTPDSQLDLGKGAGAAVALIFTSANWDTPQTVTVTAVDDFAYEAAHLGKITHGVVSVDKKYDGFTVGDVTADITDNDMFGVTITESGGTTDVTEGGATDSYDVVLNTIPTDDVVITVTPDAQTDLGSGAGVAIDLTFTPANWNTPQTVTVTAVDDAVAEGTHTSTITHSAASADTNYDGVAIDDVTANITDNEVATLTLSIDLPSISENGGKATGTVTRNTATTGNLVVTLSSSNTSEATVPATVTILDGQNSATFEITGVNDLFVDGTQNVTITAKSAGFVDGTDSLDVTNVDVETLTLAFDLAKIAENGGTATGTVSRNIAGKGVTVTLLLSDSTEATVPATVEIPSGKTSVTFTITGLDDFIADGTQTVTVTAETAGYVDGTADIDVTDDDTAGITLVESGDATNVAEGGATDSYTLVLDSEPTADVTITVTPDAQADLGAGAGKAIALTFTALNWDTPQTVTVTANDDAVAEGAHTSKITHAVTSMDPVYDGFGVGNVIADITDNDTVGITLVESGDSTDVTEGGATDSYTFVLDSEPTADVTITVTPDAQANLGAGAGTAITLTFTALNWDTPQTVTVTAVDDAVAEGAHTSKITHAVTSKDSAYDGFSVGNVIADITDNESAKLTVTLGDSAINEGGSTTGTVTRNTPAVGNLVVTLTSNDTTEAKVIATVTILDGKTSATFTVNGVDDSFDDGNRTATLTAAAAGHANGTVTIDILDNDAAGDGDDILLFDEAARKFKFGTNTGSGMTWFQSSTLAASAKGYDSFVADFDGDGDLDGAVRNRSTNNVLLFTNNGDGTLTGPVLRGTAGTAGTPGFFQAGDYDGNGRAEILWLYLDGTYAGQVFTKDLVTTAAFNMVKANVQYDAFITGDVNGDGFDDLIGLYDNDAGTRTNIIPFFSIASNNPALPRRLRHLADNPVVGQFGQSISVNGLGQFQVTDLDGDGREDIVAVTAAGKVLHATATGNAAGSGLFVNIRRFVASSRSPLFETATFSGPILVGNFDDNLLVDVMSARNDGAIFVGRSSLNQAFLNPVVMSNPALNFGSGLNGSKYVIGDFNGDGYDDIAADIGGNLSVFLSTGDGNSFGAALDFGPIIGGGVGTVGAIGVG